MSRIGLGYHCKLDNNDIVKMVIILWDGAFSLARKKNPTMDNLQQYQQFVKAAVIGHVNLGLTITPKVHLVLLWLCVGWRNPSKIEGMEFSRIIDQICWPCDFSPIYHNFSRIFNQNV